MGCRSLRITPTSTPPPGWRIPVSGLFIDTPSFPENWEVSFSTPRERPDDPTVNHVGREWYHLVSGDAWQSIWRAYSVSDAEELYEELRTSQFAPNSTLEADIEFEDFAPPEQIRFTSQIADEYYFACGVWGFTYCEMVARYRNYVTEVHLPLKAGTDSKVGLSYEQIEPVLIDMDRQFVDLFQSLGP